MMLPRLRGCTWHSSALLVAAATDDGGAVAILAGRKALAFAEDVPTVVGWFS